MQCIQYLQESVLRAFEAEWRRTIRAASTHLRSDVLQLDGQVWWAGNLRGQAAEGAGQRERQAEEVLTDDMLDNAALQDLLAKRW